MSVPPFEPHDAEYLYLQVADHVAARIAAGELPVGAKLPGEVDMAEEYGVASRTARRAVQELRDRGLVRTLPAKGTYVIATPDSGPPAGDE